MSSSFSSPGAADDPRDHIVEELVFRCLEAEDVDTALQVACRDHPDYARRVRRIVGRLRSEELLASSPATDEVPERLGHFLLLERIGAGGMGVVYLAEDQRLGRKVAVKLIRPDQLHFPGSRERFEREVEAVARLDDPGIVAIHDVGEEDGLPYYSMEYVRGVSLAQVLATVRGRQPEELRGRDFRAAMSLENDDNSDSGSSSLRAGVLDASWVDAVLHLVTRVGEALQHAHESGVLHRDVKPSNVLVTRTGRAKLVDFGLARMDQDHRLTRTTAQVGSLAYMPPEQIDGRIDNPEPTQDVYSLGVTLYELLTLRCPFLAETAEQTRANISSGQATPPRGLNPSVSWELETVCLKAMDRTPGRRYASAAEFVEDLCRVREHRPILARRAGRALRARRWVQRHPTATVAGALGFLLLAVVPTSFAIYQKRKADELAGLHALAERRGYEAGLAAAAAGLELGQIEEVKRRLELCPPELRGWEWRHFVLRSDSSIATYEQGTDIERIAVHREGRRFATAGSRGRICLWSLDQSTPLSVLEGHEDLVTGIAFSPDGSQLYSAGTDGAILVWDLAAGTHRPLPKMGEDRPRVMSMALSPTGATLAAGADDGSIRLWDTGIGERRPELLVPGGPSEGSAPPRFGNTVFDLEFSSDGRFLFAARGNRVVFWDLEGTTSPTVLVGPDDVFAWFQDIELRPGGRQLAGGCNDGTLWIWDLTSGEPVVEVRDFRDGTMRAVAYDERGQTLFVASLKGPLIALELDEHGATSRRAWSQRGHDSYVTGMSFWGDGGGLLTVSRDGTARFWRNSPSASSSHVVGRHTGTVGDLELLPHGRGLVSVGTDGELSVWDSRTGELIERVSGPPAFDAKLDLHPSGERVLCSTLGVRLHRFGESEAREISWDDQPLVAAAWHPGGERFFGVTAEGRLGIWDGTTLERLQEGRVPEALAEGDRVRRLACSPDGTHVLTGGERGIVHLWDGVTATFLAELGRHESLVTSIVFEPRTGAAVTAGYDGRIVFWDLATHAELRAISWPNQSINAIAFSPDGRRMLGGSNDQDIQVWDMTVGEPLLTLRGHTTGVTGIAFDPDGQRLFSGSRRGVIRVWNTRRP